MPLGKSPLLQMELMAEGDNSKYLLFNDAVAALEDSVNRLLSLDFSSGDVTLTESQLTRYGVFKATGHTVARELTVPATVGSAPAVATQRLFFVQNAGTGVVTITHGAGTTATAAPGFAAFIYADGTDITTVLQFSGPSVSNAGGVVLLGPTDIAFLGAGVSVADDGDGTATVTVSVPPAGVNTVTGASYNLALSDANGIVEMNNAGANTVNILADASVNFDVGTLISIPQEGAGATTITAAAGVTLNGVVGGSTTLDGQYNAVSLYKRAADDWRVHGAHGGVA